MGGSKKFKETNEKKGSLSKDQSSKIGYSKNEKAEKTQHAI